jgi:uncharacterized protein
MFRYRFCARRADLTGFLEWIKKIRKLLQPKAGIDIKVYIPEGFDQLCADQSFFKEEIVAKGKIFYENAR